MIPLLSQFFMIAAWCCAAQAFVSGVICSRHPHSRFKSFFPFFWYATIFFVWASVCLLIYSFLQSDFSLRIVYEHVQTSLPWYYKLGALWAGHEGSIVLWLFVLTLWSAAFSLIDLPSSVKTVTKTILITIHLALLSYILMTSSPFESLWPYVPAQGQDLNPLLQDLGMMFHPPILYLGYVGFALPYAMVLAAMITRDHSVVLGNAFEKVVLIAWGFLTVGITLGSFWAYYELGWGGFWFWDPVENASLLPWLVGIALLHALRMPTNNRHLSSVYLLSMWAFILSLLGTFLVRSGLLSSVHSFASDPTRGFFILMIVLFFLILGHVFYFKHQRVQFPVMHSATSRESFLLMNQIIFVIITAIVFLGTVYPLVVEAMGLGFISVGPQYFNQILLPLGAIIMVLMGLAVGSRFKKSVVLKPPMIMALISVTMIFIPGDWVLAARVGFALFTWILLQTGYDIVRHSITSRRLCMHVAHMGFAVFALGVAISQTKGIEIEQKLTTGDQILVGHSTIQLNRFDSISGPNYEGVQATLWVSTPGSETIIMKPQKRYYTFRGIAISETAIEGNLMRDWYIALGEPLSDNAWSFRIHYKPWIRLIWLGGLMMAFSVVLSFFKMVIAPFKKGADSCEA